MTAQEFVSRLAPVDLKRLALIFESLADRTDELRLLSGQALNDNLDFSAFLRELATAVKLRQDLLECPRERFSRFDYQRTCPRCGHIHQGDRECGQEMGRGAICRCELEVSA